MNSYARLISFLLFYADICLNVWIQNVLFWENILQQMQNQQFLNLDLQYQSVKYLISEYYIFLIKLEKEIPLTKTFSTWALLKPCSNTKFLFKLAF